MDRRSFLTTTVGAIAGLALAGKAVASVAPKTCVLYGDGKHDDTEALQAWADGKHVISAGYPVIVTPTEISNADFRMGRTVTMDRAATMRLTNCQFQATKELRDGQPMFDLKDNDQMYVFYTGCAFNSWNHKGHSPYIRMDSQKAAYNWNYYA